MLRIPGLSSSGWWAGVCTAVVIWGLSSLPACTCGKSSGGTIPCTMDSECPNPLVCDEQSGLCTEGGDAGAFMCEPPLPGCPCVAGKAMVPCLLADQDPTLVASCREGQATCQGGVYGMCVETANPNCESVSVGAGGFRPDDDNSENITTGPEGELILDPSTDQVEFGFLWIANTGENTVSKLDIDTGKEVARYASVSNSAALGVPPVPVGGFAGDQSDCGNCPSRTAIDFKGDAFVANRAFGEQATVTKYANETADCRDKNGNGVIDTSMDLDADGRIDVADPSEFLAEADECILWTQPVGNPSGAARALAIDAGGPDGENGNVWVGLYYEHRVVQISGATGLPVLGAGGAPVSVQLEDGMGHVAPYGAAVDGGGNVWLTGREDGGTVYLAKVNSVTATLVGLYAIPDDPDACSDSYGITIDVTQRIWVGGWRCKDMKGFDPATGSWIRVDRNAETNTRGIAVDGVGNVWVAYTGGRVGKYRVADVMALGDAAPGTMYQLPGLPPPFDPRINNTIGVGIDKNGACWAVSRNDGAAVGAATRILPDGTMESFPVGKSPYTYSDFTGFGLDTVVRPNGWWRGTISGCAATDTRSNWQRLDWSEIEPPGTSVKMRVRVADTVAGLATAAWYGPWDTPPVDLDVEMVPDTFYMEVEVQLSTTDPAVSPTFAGFSVGFDCPDIGPIP